MKAHVIAHRPPRRHRHRDPHAWRTSWRAELAGTVFDAARRALAAAVRAGAGITGEGGSIPVVGDFARVLRLRCCSWGFGLPARTRTRPYEWLSDENFTRGMRAAAMLWDELASGARAAH